MLQRRAAELERAVRRDGVTHLERSLPNCEIGVKNQMTASSARRCCRRRRLATKGCWTNVGKDGSAGLMWELSGVAAKNGEVQGSRTRRKGDGSGDTQVPPRKGRGLKRKIW